MHIVEHDLVEAVCAGDVHDGVDLHARRLHVDEEEAYAGVAFGFAVSSHEHEHHVGAMRQRCPDFRAVDDELVTAYLGIGLQ